MSTALGPYRRPSPFGAQRLVPPPTRARRIAFILAGASLAFVVISLVSPWQQNVKGSGRVIAFTPLERRQNIEAPVSGQVVEWFVQEGATVDEGDPIVRLSDNDPRLMERLEVELEAGRTRLDQYESRVSAQRTRLEAVARTGANSVSAKQARVRAARQSVAAADQSQQAAEAALDTANLNLARQLALSEQGLASERQAELARLASTRAQTARDSARARARAARDELSAKQSELDGARASRDASVESARASLQSAESDVASARAAVARLEVRVSRQQAQLVTAPRAGTIFRLVANQGGEQVSSGDTLAVLVPDTYARAVEIWVDGNDAALITAGRPVRVQFEGWPAVQFTGWPSVAVGTFGGIVAFEDSSDDGHGNFRVVVVPDPNEDPWPAPRFLRQGVRANGWVLLQRVSVAFELWRQFNGFPPMYDRPPSTDPGGSSGGSYGSSGDSYGSAYESSSGGY